MTTSEREARRKAARPATSAATGRPAGRPPTAPADPTPAPAEPEPTLRILETRVLRGPNYWAREPVVRMLVDLGVLEEFPSNTIPGFVDGLVELLPSLEDHACSLGRRGGFVTRLKEGTWAGHVAEHIALELQNLAGTDVRHGKTRSAGPYGQYNVIYEFREENVGVEAGRMAVALVNHLVDPVARRRSISSRSSSSSSGSPSGRRSGRRPRRSSTRPSAATSRSSGSTATRSSSSARASTSSGSGRR